MVVVGNPGPGCRTLAVATYVARELIADRAEPDLVFAECPTAVVTALTRRDPQWAAA